MSSVIYQEPHSPETQITDTTTTTLSLKLSLPFQEINDNPSKNPNLGMWDSLQSLSPSSQTPKDPYAHPILTGKSLELCTENLGSETGSDTDFSISSPGLYGEIATGDEPNARAETEGWISRGVRKLTRTAELSQKEMVRGKANFPPPLTTLSGSGPIHVRAHREEGRLIVKAVGGPLENGSSTCFRAERSNGRLRLCLWEEGCGSDSEPETDFQENPECEIDFEGNSGEEEEEEEDVDGNDLDVEGEMGMEKIQRPSWCKVSGGGGCGNGSFCNWEPYWVATS